ncbi:hypothetical protein IAT40_006529 [Kwoniella sp. CBS 6097]
MSTPSGNPPSDDSDPTRSQVTNSRIVDEIIKRLDLATEATQRLTQCYGGKKGYGKGTQTDGYTDLYDEHLRKMEEANQILLSVPTGGFEAEETELLKYHHRRMEQAIKTRIECKRAWEERNISEDTTSPPISELGTETHGRAADAEHCWTRDSIENIIALQRSMTNTLKRGTLYMESEELSLGDNVLNRHNERLIAQMTTDQAELTQATDRYKSSQKPLNADQVNSLGDSQNAMSSAQQVYRATGQEYADNLGEQIYSRMIRSTQRCIAYTLARASAGSLDHPQPDLSQNMLDDTPENRWILEMNPASQRFKEDFAHAVQNAQRIYQRHSLLEPFLSRQVPLLPPDSQARQLQDRWLTMSQSVASFDRTASALDPAPGQFAPAGYAQSAAEVDLSHFDFTVRPSDFRFSASASPTGRVDPSDPTQWEHGEGYNLP